MAPVEQIEFLSAVRISSKDPSKLAGFYRDVLDVHVDAEEKDGRTRYLCQLGDLFFAIHPAEDFPDDGNGRGAVRLAFTVFDLDAYLTRLENRGVKLVAPAKDLGWCRMATAKDPDGNPVEFTQLGEEFFKKLSERKRKGYDLVLRWKAVQALRRGIKPASDEDAPPAPKLRRRASK